MAQYKSKQVEGAGVDDKRQIIDPYSASLTGSFLPVQLVYQGKTSKCHPSIDFQKECHIINSANHWCNEETMKSYIQLTIAPYAQEKRKQLRLADSQLALVIFDEFKGQTTDAVLSLLRQNDIEYVLVPLNYGTARFKLERKSHVVMRAHAMRAHAMRVISLMFSSASTHKFICSKNTHG